ncbi:hypothetical protein LZL87_013796 [Fusarium oxysporum]|nr:hypothetical protein LZL87_013796 [Fusarium oxysporum]
MEQVRGYAHKKVRIADQDHLGYDDSMRRADAETNERESAIELSLWKQPPFSTLGNGLPHHRTQLLHDHVSLRSPEPSRLQRFPDETLLMIISWLSSKGDREFAFAFFALRQVSRRFRRLMHGDEFQQHQFSSQFCCQWCSDGYEDWLKPVGSPWRVRRCFEYPKCRSWDWRLSCDHEDHTRPFSEGQGPRAFATKLPAGMTVILIFWRGHSGGDPSVFHPSGYVYKTKLKDAIRNIQLQGGHHLIPQRGVKAMAEWDSIVEIDGSESISPDLIRLRGGWASKDPGRPHACSPFRTLKVACDHYEKEKG